MCSESHNSDMPMFTKIRMYANTGEGAGRTGVFNEEMKGNNLHFLLIVTRQMCNVPMHIYCKTCGIGHDRLAQLLVSTSMLIFSASNVQAMRKTSVHSLGAGSCGGRHSW